MAKSLKFQLWVCSHVVFSALGSPFSDFDHWRSTILFVADNIGGTPQFTRQHHHSNEQCSKPLVEYSIGLYYVILPSGYLTQPWKDPPCLIGKPSISGPFFMAMLNNQRVYPIQGIIIAITSINSKSSGQDQKGRFFPQLPLLLLPGRHLFGGYAVTPNDI